MLQRMDTFTAWLWAVWLPVRIWSTVMWLVFVWILDSTLLFVLLCEAAYCPEKRFNVIQEAENIFARLWQATVYLLYQLHPHAGGTARH